MSIIFNDVTNITLGSTPVEQIADSLGNVLWSAAPVVLPNYFYVEDVSGSDNTVSITKSNTNAPTIEIFASTDTVNWSSIGSTSTTAITATIPANGKLYLKATTSGWGVSGSGNVITCSDNHNIGGNIMSLIYNDDFEDKTTFPNGSTYNFYYLFQNNTKVINTSNLVLPATTLAAGCYSGMFNGCTSLTTAPAVLPANNVGNYGYSNMFNGCTSLTTAPEIYCNVFGQRACRAMFVNCTNLIKIVTYSTKLGLQSHQDWLYGASATGDFYNLGGATYPSGTSGIPTGWTEHTSL